MDRRSFALAAAAMLLASPSSAAPEEPPYPTKPIRLVATGAPGSPPDAVARIVAEPLAALGQPVLVENQAGAVGTVAMGAVARAAPDGHTLGVFGLPQMVAPALVPSISYDAERALAPVTLLVWTANVLVVHPSSPVVSLADLAARAKAAPGAMTYASGGSGTPSHLASALFVHHAGLDVRHVPYKGTPAALVALMSELVDFAFAGAATALPLVKAGKLRALATAGAQRLPALPDVPTVAERGPIGFTLNEWYAVAAPAGTPAPILAQLADVLTRAVASAAVTSRLEQLGLYPTTTPGQAALGALIRAELPRWKQIVRDANIRAE